MTPTKGDCPYCQEPIEGEGYDPDHNYGCGWASRRTGELSCHEIYCDKDCFNEHCERGAEREYERFHESGPIGPTSEERAEWQRLKD